MPDGALTWTKIDPETGQRLPGVFGRPSKVELAERKRWREIKDGEDRPDQPMTGKPTHGSSDFPEQKTETVAKPQSEVSRQLAAAKRMLRVAEAREDLLKFTMMTQPHPDDPDDLERSQYEPALHHRALAKALEEVEKGHIPRLIVCMPPRHGKSELVSKRFISWYMGRDPYRSVIFATYSDTFAEDFGREVRHIVRGPIFSQIFPSANVRPGAASASRIQMGAGGLAAFVGRGGAITGRGAHLLVIDDPIKDAEEADSPTTRQKTWEWFTKVAMTRLMTVGASVVIVITRWHEDDIVGRLTDPQNPYFDAQEADRWKIINLPAEAEVDDPLGRSPGQPLWPERFDLKFLQAQKRLNPRGYSALYQQRPTPDDGEFFRREWIIHYEPSQLPDKLTVYAASDHAIGEDKSRNDATVLMVCGIDDKSNIWLLDCWHGRENAKVVIERMCDLMAKWKPMIWWAEKGHITKSIGPFLRKRMAERTVYCAIEEVTPIKNKVQRAQSIQGRMAMRLVRFPKGPEWSALMIDELMKFPHARHDDFVDTLAWIGMGLQRQVGPGSGGRYLNDEIPRTGTLAWIKWSSEREAARRRQRGRFGGF